MTTLADVVARTRSRLMGQQREPINTLSVGINNTDTNLVFTNTIRFVDGSRISIDLETMHIVAVSGGGSGATVIRSVEGTAASHSSGVICQINPTWTNYQILQAVNDELADLSSPVNGLFRVRSLEFNYSPSVAGYQLVGLNDFLSVWRVRYKTPGPDHTWPVITRSQYRVDLSANTTDFASGAQIVLYEGGHTGHPVRVSYRASFDPLAALGDDVATVSGLHAEAHDILSLGAAMRLLDTNDAQRSYSTSQADPRRGDEAVQNVNTLSRMERRRQERITAEQARLARRYPESLS